MILRLLLSIVLDALLSLLGGIILVGIGSQLHAAYGVAELPYSTAYTISFLLLIFASLFRGSAMADTFQ